MITANDNLDNKANDFYVYTWTRPDTSDVFYVGKGRGVRSKKLSGRNSHFKRIVGKLLSLGMAPVISHVADGLSEDDAFELEVRLISQYGRIKDGGTLCNMTSGGEGRSGDIHSEESRRKLSASLRIALSDPEIREKIRQRGIERYKDPGVRAAHGAMISARYEDPAAREKNSIALRGIPKSPEHIQKVSEVLTESWSGNTERRENHKWLTLRRGPTKSNTSGYKGVSFDKSSGRWMAQIEVDKRNKHLGRYENPEGAAKAYDDGAIRYYGTGVYLNFPTPSPANDNVSADSEVA